MLDGCVPNSANMKRLPWDKYFLLQCRLIASRSTCMRRKVGALIVVEKHIISTGYVGQFSGVSHCTDVGCRKLKYGNDNNFCIAVHAEENALLQAARLGTSVRGGTLYSSLQPCRQCLKMAVVAGIKRIVYERPYSIDSSRQDEKVDGFWKELAQSVDVTIEQVTLDENDLKVLQEISEPDFSRNRFRNP